MMIFVSDWGVESAGWDPSYDDGVLTLTPADADAALTLECFRKKRGRVEPGDLRAFAMKRLPRGIAPSPAVCGEFQGLYAEALDDDSFRRFWFLASGARSLFVTYSSRPDDRGRHREVVTWMLSLLAEADAD